MMMVDLHCSFTDIGRLPRAYTLVVRIHTTVVVMCLGYAWPTLLAKCEWRDADQAGPGLPSN